MYRGATAATAAFNFENQGKSYKVWTKKGSLFKSFGFLLNTKFN